VLYLQLIHVRLSTTDQAMKVKFVVKLETIGDDKMHVLVPKMHRDFLMPLVGKQVRVVIDDEI
jgi:hypothetical protein